MANNNPNVGFKIGAQSTMDSLLRAGVGANAIPGTFYLTSDTNRLYIGKDDKSIAPVNAGIITVDRVQPKAGDPETFKYVPLEPTDDAEKDRLAGNYYYATEDNILCIFNGKKWVQINSVVINKELTTLLSKDANSVIVETTVKQSAGDDVSDTYSVTGDNGITVSAIGKVMTISTETPITLAATQGTGDKTVNIGLTSSLNSEGKKQEFNLIGGANVDSISVVDKDITINVKDTVNTDMTNSVRQDGTDKAWVGTKVTQVPGAEVESEFAIVGSNGIGVVASTDEDDAGIITLSADQVKVGVGGVTGGAAISLTSGLIDSTNKDFNIIAGDNVSVKAEGKNVTISAVDKDTTVEDFTTELTNDGTTVSITTTLTPSEGDEIESAFTITGAGGITVNSENEVLTIASEAVKVEIAEVTENSEVSVSLTSGLIDSTKKDFNIIAGDNVSVNAEGKNITFSAVDTKVNSIALKAEDEGFTLSLSPSEGAAIESSFNPTIIYGDNEEVSFKDNTATLDVYSKSDVDSLILKELQLFNSMTYKCVIDDEEKIPTVNVSVGDTYLIGKDNFNYNNNFYPAGTLMIATSSWPSDDGEDEGGHIPVTPEKSYIVWEFVTGSQVDTHYSFKAIENGIQLSADRGEEGAAGTLTIIDDVAKFKDTDTETYNDIIVSKGNSSGNSQELKISHKLYGDVEASASDPAEMENKATLTFIAVDSIDVSNGHIKGFTTKEITVRDTNATLTKNEASVENLEDGNGVKIGHTVKLTPSAGDETELTSYFSITSTSLEIANNGPAGSGVVMNLVWGTF